MFIDIQSRDFSLTDSLRNHAKWRLHFALTCYSDQIQRVSMRLSDINGPRGGPDKRCHLTVSLAGLPDVITDDVEANLYVAIGRATDRARHTIMRKIERHKTLSMPRRGRPVICTEPLESLEMETFS